MEYTMSMYRSKDDMLAAMRAEITQLRAENERLREALTLILESKDIRFTWPREIAKEALK